MPKSIDTRMEEMFAEMVRLCPPRADLQQVAPVAPLSLQEGEQRLRRVLDDRDWLTSMAIAKRLALTDGWRAYLLACAKQGDSLWGTLDQMVLARYHQLTELETQIEALATAIDSTTTREARCPLVQQQTVLDIGRGFLTWLSDRWGEGVKDAGGTVDPVVNVLSVITMEAHLQNPDVWQWGMEIGECLASVLQPEHLQMDEA